MEAYSSRELLCIPGKNKSYAIETAYVTELCCQIQLSRIPCMPEYYAGVCSYKGNIIPVIKLHSEEDPGEDSLLLAVESPADMGDSGIWAGKEICRHEKEILFVIDMEKTVEGLIICQ